MHAETELGPDGSPQTIRGSLQDVTERIEAERVLAQAMAAPLSVVGPPSRYGSPCISVLSTQITPPGAIGKSPVPSATTRSVR